MTQTAKPPPGETVVFVCPHGAGMSRLAAALFNQAAPAGWKATSAGLEPAEAVNDVAAGLVAGTAAAAYFDHSPPRPLTEVAGAATVSINCTAPGAARWDLAATTIGEPMREGLCRRTEQLAIQLRDGVPTPIANASPHLQEHPND